MKLATISDVIRNWADIQPDAAAFVSEGREPLTYRMLSHAIDDIRETLNASGFGRGDRLAIVHSGGPQLATAIYGVISGATAAPMKPTLTAQEFATQFEARRVDGLIVESGLDTPARDEAARLGLPILELDSNDDAVTGMVKLRPAGVRNCPLPGTCQAEDIAFVLATSATTARSKIVPITHRQHIARSAASVERFGIRQNDRCLNLMPLIYGQGRLAFVLLSGGSIGFMSSFDAPTFFRYLVTLKPTWFQGSYTFHHMIHDQARDYTADIRQSQLRFIRASSGRLEPGIADELERIFGVPVLESYSSNETGRIAGNGLEPGARKRGTVGRAAGCEVALMGADNRVLATGEEGEVLVRGPGVMDGYEGDSELNAAAFIDGWFRTGDLGYLDEEGFLTLTGRIKEMINRGGEKISPAEVDAVMMSHPAVAQAVTFPIPHPTLGQLPAAAVVAKEGVEITRKDLSRFLRERLAEFKVPRLFVFVEEIPRSDAGKIQRNRLAEQLGVAAAGAKIRTAAASSDV